MKKLWAKLKKIWKFVLLYLLMLITFSYAMFQGGFVSWFLFYSFLPFSIYGTMLSFYSMNEFEISRELPKINLNAGDQLKVVIKIKRHRRFPLLYLLLEDQIDQRLKYAGQTGTTSTLLFPGLKKELSYEYIIEGLPRGEHFFHSVSLRFGDPLGLFEKAKILPLDGRVIVYPSFEELLYRPFENQYDQGLTASRERVQRDTTMAVAVREYQPGDRFSWINWKASAKRNEIMTKEFEQRQSHDVLVVMDCVPDRRFEAIVSFTASIVRAILKKGAQTGLLTVSKDRDMFPIRGGEQQLQQLFYHLAKIEAQSSFPLDKVLESDVLFVQQTVSLMVVTANLNRLLMDKVSLIGQKKGALTLFLIKAFKEVPDETERSIMEFARARGVRVLLVHEGDFANSFLEVK